MENTRTVWSTVILNWDRFFSNPAEFQEKSAVLWTVDKRGELSDSVYHDTSNTVINFSYLLYCIVLYLLYCTFKYQNLSNM